jgi:acetyl-CoA carboxylase biotin carboxyl carrier protein
VSDLAEVQATLVQLIGSLPERPRRLRLSAGDVSVELDWTDDPRPPAVPPAGPPGGPAAASPAANGTAANGTAPHDTTPNDTTPNGGNGGNGAAAGAAPGVHQVCSPSVGTFYRAPEPGSAPFVNEGDLVQVGQQIAIVEAMKLMLPIEADRAGRVTAILKADGEQVEYAEPLVSLAPPAADG